MGGRGQSRGGRRRPAAGGGVRGAASPRLPQEREAVDRLCGLGFDRNDALQAFLACDKDEMLAANLLLNGQFGE